MSPTGRRAALYARYSTDLQRDRSIDDQLALCRDHAARQGLIVVREYADRARTSASLIGRDGIADLLADAKARAFDVVLVEALDRISRDQEDLAAVHKRLAFAEVELRSVADGRADVIQIGVHGLMGQIWMQGHKAKVRRGMQGVIRDGRSAGGRAYGYRAVPGQPGVLAIDETEAAVVRRIWAAYAEGDSARAIAGSLNADGIAPPRGRAWNASTINGSAARGYGILRNPIYTGRQVWGRVTMIRDPDTGRRVSRLAPEDDRRAVDAEHLRLVDPATAARVAARLASRVGADVPRGRAAARPQRPLSGLLRCGACGAGMAIMNREPSGAIYIQCSRSRESGGCRETGRPRLDRIEAAIFGRLAEELRDPVYAREYVREYNAERRRLSAATSHNRDQLERAVQRARGAYDRAHRLYVEGVTDGPEAELAIRRLLDAKREAEASLASAATTAEVVTLHPAALDRYADAMAELAVTLTADHVPTAPLRILRELIDQVVVTRDSDTLTVEVHGRLGALLGLVSGELVVAEEGLEPPTRGL